MVCLQREDSWSFLSVELPRGPAPQSRETVLQTLRDTLCPQSPFTLNSSSPSPDLGIMRRRTVGAPKRRVMMPGPSCFCPSLWVLTLELLAIRRWPWTFFPISAFFKLLLLHQRRLSQTLPHQILVRINWGGNVLEGSVPGKDALGVSWESKKNATLWRYLRTSLGNLQRTQTEQSIPAFEKQESHT